MQNRRYSRIATGVVRTYNKTMIINEKIDNRYLHITIMDIPLTVDNLMYTVQIGRMEQGIPVTKIVFILVTSRWRCMIE